MKVYFLVHLIFALYKSDVKAFKRFCLTYMEITSKILRRTLIQIYLNLSSKNKILADGNLGTSQCISTKYELWVSQFHRQSYIKYELSQRIFIEPDVSNYVSL